MTTNLEIYCLEIQFNSVQAVCGCDISRLAAASSRVSKVLAVSQPRLDQILDVFFFSSHTMTAVFITEIGKSNAFSVR